MASPVPQRPEAERWELPQQPLDDCYAEVRGQEQRNGEAGVDSGWMGPQRQ